MQKISKLLAASTITLMSLAFSGCAAPEPQADPPNYQQFLETVIDDEYGMIDFAGGGGSIGSTITTHDFAAGWYAVDLACQGNQGATFVISHDGSTLGNGTTGCASTGFTTTTMELPAGSISATAQSEDPDTVWHVRYRPTTAPSSN